MPSGRVRAASVAEGPRNPDLEGIDGSTCQDFAAFARASRVIEISHDFPLSVSSPFYALSACINNTVQDMQDTSRYLAVPTN